MCIAVASFPSRERGLKPDLPSLEPGGHLVVPFAGTWIETPYAIIIQLQMYVVPFAGTWIETIKDSFKRAFFSVVPFAGAWIETPRIPDGRGGDMSFPSRERGLKLFRASAMLCKARSFPSRERGLKPA